MRRGRVGLRLSETDPPTVLAVLPGSAAERAGLRVGDQLDAGARARLSRCCAGVPIILSLDRGDLTLDPDPRPEERYPDLDVSYGEVPRGEVTLRTIRVSPRCAPRAVVLYAQGSDLYSVERATAGEADPLRGFVTHLARAGYAVVRVERRGVGDSTGEDPGGTSWEDEREDLAAALASIDDTRVVLFGHSLGAMHAAALAPRDPRVRAVALYGAGIDPWRVYLDANLRRQLALADVPADRADAIARALARFHDAVLGEGAAPGDAIRALDAEVRAWAAVDGAGRVHAREAAYWRAVDREDVAAGLRALRVPALALWGESDWLAAREEHARIAQVARGVFATVRGADHGFADFETPRASFEARGVGRWQPRVGDALVAWLAALEPGR